jgi:hypothetical protein
MIIRAVGPGSTPQKSRRRPSGNRTSRVPRRNRAAKESVRRAVSGKPESALRTVETVTGMASLMLRSRLVHLHFALKLSAVIYLILSKIESEKLCSLFADHAQ